MTTGQELTRDILANSKNDQWYEIPGMEGSVMTGSAHFVELGDYAEGYLIGITEPLVPGQWTQLLIQDDSRKFTLPMVVTPHLVTDQIRQQTGNRVRIQCVPAGRGIHRLSGDPYIRRGLQIKPAPKSE